MRISLAFLVFILAGPANAASTDVAEPSGLALFALGVLGVVVGRKGARRNRD